MPAKTIGGTDAGPLLAYYKPSLRGVLDKYSTAADVWMRLVHDVTKLQNSRMTRGLKVEPELRVIYERDVGPCGESPGVIRHPLLSGATCSPDALTARAIVEFKTASEFGIGAWGEPMTDQVPAYYLTQCLFNCFVCDRPEAHLLVAFGKDLKDEAGEPVFSYSETRLYLIPRDEELERELVTAAQRFMVEHVTPRIPPNVEPRESKRKWKAILKGEALEQ